MSTNEYTDSIYDFVRKLLEDDNINDAYMSTAYLNSREIAAIKAIVDLRHALLSYREGTPVSTRLAILDIVNKFEEKAKTIARLSRSDTSKMPILASLLNVTKDLSKNDPDTALMKQLLDHDKEKKDEEKKLLSWRKVLKGVLKLLLRLLLIEKLDLEQ